MNLKDLQQHIDTLIHLEKNTAPIISCYLNLEAGKPNYHNAFLEQARALRKRFHANDVQGFDQALTRCLLRYPEPEAHVLHAEAQAFA